MAPAAIHKRKDPPRSGHSQGNRPNKRVKIQDARKVLTQTSDKALSKNGDLDVAAFVKAREFEIKAMAASMSDSKRALTTRAFQQVPHSMRRRTASHNVKRVPKRLRARAAKEMKDDNTPTVTHRRRKVTPHMRIRLGKAKELKELGALTKKKRIASKAKRDSNDAAVTPDGVANEPRLPQPKKNTLSKPNKPPAKFRKRQIHKSWLPTHVWHAKRARMTDPKDPLWRFAIPLTPTEKCFRTTHRASNIRGCVAWDMSYIGTIAVEGVEKSLLGLLRSVGLPENMLTRNAGVKWRRGTRSWEGWIRERDRMFRWIAPVKVVWCASEDVSGEPEADGKGSKPEKRKLILRVHPSAFLEVWNEILKVAKMQRPSAMVEDLRFDIGSIEVSGPGSTEALVGCLNALSEGTSTAGRSGTDTEHANEDGLTMHNAMSAQDETEWVDEPTPSSVFPKLAALTNVSSLPPSALLAFNISDPRLHHPPQTVKPSTESADDTFLNLISSWPPDHTTTPSSLFSRNARLTASRLLCSQKAINRRKALAPPGSFAQPLATDPKIPCILLASRPESHLGKGNQQGQGSWTVLLPWSCVLPVWYSLMHYPLSSGGTPRFGGLQEKRQVSFEQQCGWFPGDFPGTRSGWAWEMKEREVGKQQWERRPKGRRTEWESVDLGATEKTQKRKGEVGVGWGCDWERLFQGPPAAPPAAATTAGQVFTGGTDQVNEKTPGILPDSAADATGHTEQMDLPPKEPPLSIHYLEASALTKRPLPTISPTALTPVNLTLLSTGHPSRNARIYRLPTTSPSLLSRWLAMCSTVHQTAGQARDQRGPANHRIHAQENLPQHEKTRRLAMRMFNPPHQASKPLKPGDPAYPPVPDECDLIGFVTAANYQLGQGRCEAIGNIAPARILGGDGTVTADGGSDRSGSGSSGGREGPNSRLCIVRDSGQGVGRLARWTFL